MEKTNKRPILLLLDKSHENYSDEKVAVGELIVDASPDKGFLYLKTKDGKIIEIKGAGFTELFNYIKNTTAINIPPKDKHSFHIDNSIKIPSDTAKTGVLKIRVPSSEGLNQFEEVSLTTNGSTCIIKKEDGTTISATDFFKDYAKFKEGSSSSSEDHETRIDSLEKNVADRAVDSVIHYKHFTQEEVGDLLFKISPDKDTKEVFKNEFESTITLGTDDGTSINKHFLGLTVDNIEHTYNSNHFYIRDKGNVVDLAVKFYYKDGDVYIRPTQTEGEFILRDKSTNKGTFKKFKGIVSEESWKNTGLTPANEIRPIGQARNEESTSFVCRQDNHGFKSMTLVYFDADTNTWKKANLENRAVAVLVPIDENYFYTYTNGHIKIPENVAMNYQSNKLYYLSQTEDGGMQVEEPIYIYQEIGYCYSKNGIKWFAISIGTPVELAPYAIKDFATKTEVSQRVRYVDNVEMLPNIIEPEGCVIIVADPKNWHTRKVSATQSGNNPIQIQNGLYANVSSSDTELRNLVDTKFDKGKETSGQLSQFPNAVAVIDELKKKLTVPDDFDGGFSKIVEMIESKIPKANISQSMVDTSPDKVVSSATFKQLVDLVQSIADGGIGAIIPQDNTPVHIEEGTLTKTTRTITSQARALYNPILSIEGQIMPRDKYDFTTNGGVINLKEAYSDVADVKYVLIDIFPTDIKFVADTVGAVAAAPYASSLKAGDVIRILGRATKYDGGGHLRIVAAEKGLDGQQIGSLYLNKVPYSDGQELHDAINTKLSTDAFNSFKAENTKELEKKLDRSDSWRIRFNNLADMGTPHNGKLDLNKVRDPGFYRCVDDSWVRDNVINSPVDRSFTLMTHSISYPQSYSYQILFPYWENTFFIRYLVNEEISPWVKFSGDTLIEEYKKDNSVYFNDKQVKSHVSIVKTFLFPKDSSACELELDTPFSDVSTTEKLLRAYMRSMDGHNIYYLHAYEIPSSDKSKVKVRVVAYANSLETKFWHDVVCAVTVDLYK